MARSWWAARSEWTRLVLVAENGLPANTVAGSVSAHVGTALGGAAATDTAGERVWCIVTSNLEKARKDQAL
jgi:hypothetical protein